MANPSTLAAISNMFNSPLDTWEVSSRDPSEEHIKLYRVCLAISIFVFTAWVTERFGWWSHAMEAGILQQYDEDRRQDREEELQRRTGEGGYLHPDGANQQEIDEQIERELQREYHIQPKPAFWTLIKFSFVIFIIVSRWNVSFSTFAEDYDVSTTWINYLTFMFGEVSFGGLEKVGCVLLAWVVMGLGDMFGVEGARDVHCDVDACVRRWLRRVRGLGKEIAEGVWWGLSSLKEISVGGEVEEVEREWTAWEVEEREQREQRELELPVAVAEGGWSIRM